MIDPSELAAFLLRQSEAARVNAQGHGKRIISATIGDQKFVAIGSKILRGKWKTFPDFLMAYISAIFTAEWGNSELAKPEEDQHPLMAMYRKVCAAQSDASKAPGEVFGFQTTGAVSAYMGIAYDLYCIEHNSRTHPKWSRLMQRLRTAEHFKSACYEVSTAAAFSRAGFEVDFEDDSDLTSDHVEFVATHRLGRRFAVECKARNSTSTESSPKRVARQLSRALNKSTELDRIVFIELDLPAEYSGDGMPQWLRAAISQLERLEAQDRANSLPSAYVFLTNRPGFRLHDSTKAMPMGYLHGFRIHELRYQESGPLAELVESRERHPEVYELLKSMNQHTSPPNSFSDADSWQAPDEDSERAVQSPLDYYDFMRRACSGWSRKQLLNAMKDWAPLSVLEATPTEQLAKDYAIRWATNFLLHVESKSVKS